MQRVRSTKVTYAERYSYSRDVRRTEAINWTEEIEKRRRDDEDRRTWNLEKERS
jgi:hypothetical protein